MPNWNRIFAALFGDPRDRPIEERLLSAISLLNGVTNLAGVPSLLLLANAQALVSLHIVTGIVFLVIYYLSRFRGHSRYLYAPFIGVIAVFLAINIIWNAGSQGGAHYYLIPALIIAAVVSRRPAEKVVAIGLFIGIAALIFWIERYQPGLIKSHSLAPSERWADVAGNFLFVQLFTGILLLIITKSLEEERGKSERLLLNILPERIADELKRTDKVTPLHYESATVLFTDFVGFTQAAEQMTPEELVGNLDDYFREFDRIIEHHNLEKIKTIGDAYMAASGIPDPNESHAPDCVRAALDIIEFIESKRTDGERSGESRWQLRIGIHTGPLVAGVIGQSKFIYDVWGDTVNTASRMESSGVIGEVNISGATYALVKDVFECESRGKIVAKNKGAIDMYLARRRTTDFPTNP